MEVLLNYWGLITVAITFIVIVIFDYQLAKSYAKDLIFLAEEKARKLSLESGMAKYGWVVDQYKLLPMPVKLFISQDLFAKIVQATFDKIHRWAEKEGVR